MSDDFTETMSKIVDIFAKPKTKVKLLMKNGEIWGGYESDKKLALKYLTPDTIYTIDHIDVYGWSSKAYLEEVPNVGFNSVMFENIKE